MRRVLFISGPMGSGKSTVARTISRLASRDHMQPCTLKFAEPLYEIHDAAKEILARYGYEFPTPISRSLLQTLGTEWGRKQISEDLWVNCIRPRIDTLLCHPSTIVIVDDVRFPNELALALQYESCRVRLTASEDARRNRAEKWGSQQHESETSITTGSQFDLYFDTTYSQLEDVACQIWDWMRKN